MNDWPYPTLLADVGGTSLRFAVATGADARPAAIRKLRTADYPNLAAAAQDYLARLQRDADDDDARAASAVAPASAALAVATPVEAARAGPVRLTNQDFVIDGARLLSSLGLSALWIVNDFEALAWSLPTLGAQDLRIIGKVVPAGNATMAVIGPGTGMGCAGLLRSATGWHAIPGEGGHVTLSARTPFEREVLAAAAGLTDHVSAEKLLSGSGMPLLYQAVAAVVDATEASHPQPKASDITRAALDGTDRLSLQVVDTFCALLGGYAGNVALSFGAVGGVMIGGGVASHLAEPIAKGVFRERFEDKGRFAAYLRPIGTALITREQPALDGLVHALSIAPGALPVQRRAVADAGRRRPPAGITPAD